MDGITLTSVPEATSMISSEKMNSMDEKTIRFREARYYSYLDEKYFYAWLESLEDVVAVRGTVEGLCVELRTTLLSRSCAHDLLALFSRYGYPLAPIKPHINPDDIAYFRDPAAYWFEELYGGARGSDE